MITLTGTLRQSGEVTFGKDKEARTMCKLWVEHQTARESGPGDLKIEEFFVPVDDARNLPAPGKPVSVVVRPYSDGKRVAFQAIRLAPGDAADPLLS
jgi:hypothetical protein